MTMVILGGNQRKAERIARDIVKDLTVSDIGFTVQEGMELEGEQRLCSAVDEDFLKDERSLHALDHKLRETLKGNLAKCHEELEDLRIRTSVARQKACFLLGYEAALRLLGVNGKPKRKRGR